MPHMKPQTYTGPYLEIDGPMGTEFLPCDVADITEAELDAWSDSADDEGPQPVPDCLKDYTQNQTANTIERHTGALSRYSAPGYLDRTDWQPGTESDLAESFDVCPTCHDQCWDTSTPCLTKDDVDLSFVLNALHGLANHPAFADSAPEFNEGGIGYRAIRILQNVMQKYTETT